MIRSPQILCARAFGGRPRVLLATVAAVLVIINLAAFRRAIGWEVFHNTDSEVMLGAARDAGWREALHWISGPWIGAQLCLYYRPTSSWLIWGEWALFGWRGAGYQWVSMGLHLAAALLFWRIGATLFARRRNERPGLGAEALAVIAALIFSLRPRNVRTLAVLTAQPDLVAAAFMFLSLLLLARCLESASRRRTVALLAGSLLAVLLSLGAKEMALSLPLLASLVVMCDRHAAARRKAWLLGALWATFAVFAVGRTFAMGGLGYLPKGWRDPAQALATMVRSGGLYFAFPFASAVLTREWWSLAMFGVIGGYAAAAWRWRALRRQRVVIYGALPALAGIALALAALFYEETWAGLLTSYPWVLLGKMLLYGVGAALIIARDPRAALFAVLWGLFTFAPAAYRVYDWPGKFFYIPHTFWALAGALLVDALAAARRRWKRDAAAAPPAQE